LHIPRQPSAAEACSCIRTISTAHDHTVSNEDAILSGEVLREAFRHLDDRLARRGITGDVFVFGGAAVVLGFDARPATRDVDALWRPHGIVLEEAWAVAETLHLPRWWLNDQASSYLPGPGMPDGATAYAGRALRVTTAHPELLLAMKVRAARAGDRHDIVLLAHHLQLTDADAIVSLAERVFGEPVPERQRQVVADLFGGPAQE
jgi:hypothetical protein